MISRLKGGMTEVPCEDIARGTVSPSAEGIERQHRVLEIPLTSSNVMEGVTYCWLRSVARLDRNGLARTRLTRSPGGCHPKPVREGPGELSRACGS